MKLLLTAFDPFGGDKVNPALEAVKLVSSHVNNVEVVKAEVPTVFRKSIATVAAAIAKKSQMPYSASARQAAATTSPRSALPSI